jgi:predicted permease
VVGRAIVLDGLAVTIAGVMPPGFRLALPPGAGKSADADVWTPLAVPLADFRRGDGRLLDRDSDNAGAVVARLAPGASLRAAQEDMARIAADLRAEVPERAAAGAGLDVRPFREDATRHVRGVLAALVAGAAAVLLVTCLNLGTLLLARGVARARERAVRAALGAARGHLVRQAVVEAVVLVGIGSVAASLLVVLAAAVLDRVLPVSLVAAAGAPGLRDLGLVLAPAAGVAALAAAVVALQAGGTTAVGTPGSALRPSGPTRSRARRALVTGEVALAVVLVVGAGLLMRTVRQLRDVRPGFEARGALTFRASIRTPDRYRGPAERAALVRRIEEGILALPGVSAVGLAGALPLSGDRWTQPWGLPGQAPSEWQENRADFRVATSGTFGALGARLLEGRSFTAREDLSEDERVVVVDEILARRLAPTGSALGRVIGFPLDGSAVAARVVGVVEHVRHDALEMDGRETIWVPYRQEAARELAFVVRAGGDPLALAPAVRGVLRSVDPDVPVFDVRTLEAYVAGAVAPRRFALALLATFAALGLTCAAVGLYGVVSWEVGRRTRDLGLRMAVGAAPERVLRSVLAGGLRLAAGGVLGGLVLAAGFARALRGLVYGVGAADPFTWAAAVALVLAVTLLASGVPALRASRLDPARALRDG